MYSFILNGDNDETPWHTANGNKSHLLNKDNGGTEFFDLLENPGPNECFLILPDFTWEKNDMPEVGHEYFSSKGIYPHNCSTELKSPPKSNKQFICKIKGGNLMIESISGGNYSIKLYSINGKNIHTISNEKINIGRNNISLSENGLAKGIYFLELSCDGIVIVEQINIR